MHITEDPSASQAKKYKLHRITETAHDLRCTFAEFVDEHSIFGVQQQRVRGIAGSQDQYLNVNLLLLKEGEGGEWPVAKTRELDPKDATVSVAMKNEQDAQSTPTLALARYHISY